jgi:hypothetical protein
LAYIKKIFAHEDLRVERFRVEVITPKGGTLKLTWDREKVGQRRDVNFAAKDGPGERDESFQESLETALTRVK